MDPKLGFDILINGTPRTLPGTVPGFRTEREAEAWIAEQKKKDTDPKAE